MPIRLTETGEDQAVTGSAALQWSFLGPQSESNSRGDQLGARWPTHSSKEKLTQVGDGVGAAEKRSPDGVRRL